MRTVLIVLLGLSTTLTLVAQASDPVVVQARSLMDSGQEEKAVELLEKAVATKPNDAARHFWLASAYGSVAEKGSMFKAMSLARKASAEFEKTVELDPNFVNARLALVEYYLMVPRVMGGSIDKAHQQAIEIRKRDTLAGHRAFAEVAAAKKDLKAARAEYAAAMRENPRSPEPRYWYGIFLTLTEANYKAAAEEFDTILRNHPNYMPAHYWIGRLAVLTSANLARGEEALRKYLTYAPDDDDPPLHRAHYWLGIIYEKQGKKSAARNEFQAALRLRPSDKDAKEALKRLS